MATGKQAIDRLRLDEAFEFASETGGILLSFDSETLWEKPEV